MALKRFFTSNGPKAVGPYCTAVIAGETIYCSGMLGIIPETGKLAEGGVEAEAVQAVLNIQTVASELNVELSDAVKTVVYLKDMSDFAAVNAVYKQAFGPDYPARTCIAVASLPLGASVEIDVTYSITADDEPFDL